MNNTSVLSSAAHAASRLTVHAVTCTDGDILAASKKILASRQFSKAHRCAALLDYLVQRMLNRDDPAPPPEHEIGIAVFGRDRMTYYTSDDPIVRVQAGRLRLRLAAYYAEEGAADPLRITIPLGSYQPKVESTKPQSAAPQPAVERAPLLMFRPLACLSTDPLVSSYAHGLTEELGYRLYRALSAFRRIDADIPLAALGALSTTRVLEGTVRRDTTRVRVSLLLRRVGDNAVLWYEQFDCTEAASISAQEHIAERCLKSLQAYLPT
jgi:TolB-like protein